ncbi:MAG TPA: class I adenylate-forming enzyme family protein [Caulobacteraceae bacterium]|jgi:acyl-CoA synthetase (AMP-forming)/AMP-acid ligase II|nr:class I adenylate-forming enzyme family protein [Caulobacteraceae bacterium]
MMITDILERVAATAPENIAIMSAEESITYRDLVSRINRVADRLAELGLRQGDAAAIALRNSIHYIVIHFALAKMGVAAIHLTRGSGLSQLPLMPKHFYPKFIVTDDSLAELLKTDDILQFRGVVLCVNIPGSEIITALWVADRGGDWASEAPLNRRLDDPEAPLAITFSGGSTGRPKAVVTSHRARVATALALKEAFALQRGHKLGVATPLFHSAGLFSWVMPGIAAAATIVLLRQWKKEDASNIISESRIDSVFLVPAQIFDLAHSVELDDRVSLTRIFHAAAPLSSKIREIVKCRLPRVTLVEFYGLSETGTVAVSPPAKRDPENGSVGRVIESVTVDIIGFDEKSLPAGALGEITVKTDQLFSGYAVEGEPSTYKAPNTTWHRTGDLGRLGANGELYLEGRVNDVINRGGVKVFADQIEAMILKCPGVAACVTVPLEDERLGTVPGTIVVAQEHANVTKAKIDMYIKSELPGPLRPARLIICDHIPLTPVGKVDRQKVIAALQASSTLLLKADSNTDVVEVGGLSAGRQRG